MWCLETIKAINKEVSKGKTVDEAYKDCGITPAERKPVKNERKKEEQPLKAAG